MPTSTKDLLAAANAAVPKISPQDAKALLDQGKAVIVDVRDGMEVAASGKAAGALHIARGLLEFKADPELPSHEKALQKDKTVILYCASGGRSALAGKLLVDLGYGDVRNLGGFKDWLDAGGPIDKA
ncbi:MAG: rhodanese-like domain-containing protein [Rhodospirillales bacterium]